MLKSIRSKRSKRSKSTRVRMVFECNSCIQNGVKKVQAGISRYITQKNRHNIPNQLELKKLCPYCYKHMIHREIKGKKLYRTKSMSYTLKANFILYIIRDKN